MAWRTPRTFLKVLDLVKFSKITNEPTQQSLIGTGDDTTTKFTTPFALGQILPYFDGVLQTTGFTISRETGPGGRDELVFSPAPAANTVITASSPDAVNVDVFETHALAAQAKIRGPVDAALYQAPADDADPATIPPLLQKWFDAITKYYLCRDTGKPGLLDAYKEAVAGYEDVCGIGMDLSQVAKGSFSLRGVLPYRGNIPPFTPAIDKRPPEAEFSSRPKIYQGGKGVF